MNLFISIVPFQKQASLFFALMKPRLSFLVSFSFGFGYILASNEKINIVLFCILFLSSFLISGCGVAINQILEIKYDSVMDRTKDRPLPTYSLTKTEAKYFAFVVGFMGLTILYLFSNILTTFIALFSLLIYAYVYTPLKRVGVIAVFVGAIPGALPPLLGWTAFSGSISYEALIIFGIQFIWQFPHFWAIAWVSDVDYKKAGFQLLPFGGKKDLKTAIIIMIYALFLIPIGLLPAYFHITGINSAVIATICGVLFLLQTFILIRDRSDKAATNLMFASFIYLPVVQISFLFDKT
ncbi:MAG: heme o synthase [Chitinophagaceae bacterium]|nr:heme o synthase [Chitinophagaceae bacterium]